MGGWVAAVTAVTAVGYNTYTRLQYLRVADRRAGPTRCCLRCARQPARTNHGVPCSMSSASSAAAGAGADAAAPAAAAASAAIAAPGAARAANVLAGEKKTPSEFRSPACSDDHWSGVARGASFTFEVAFDDSYEEQLVVVLHVVSAKHTMQLLRKRNVTSVCGGASCCPKKARR